MFKDFTTLSFLVIIKPVYTESGPYDLFFKLLYENQGKIQDEFKQLKNDFIQTKVDLDVMKVIFDGSKNEIEHLKNSSSWGEDVPNSLPLYILRPQEIKNVKKYPT